MEVVMKTISTSNVFKIAAIISYIIGYIYLKFVLCQDFFGVYGQSVWMLIFAVLFILWTESFAYLLGNTYQKLKENGKSVVEPIIFMICVLLQSIAACVYGLHRDWDIYQLLIWHGTIIYYVMCRMGILAAGRSGIFFLTDCFTGAVMVPISNFLLRARKLFHKEDKPEDEEKDFFAPDDEEEKPKNKDLGIIAVSVVVAIIVCAIAISQLVGVSKTFAGISEGFVDFWVNIFSIDSIAEFFEETFPIILLSIPFGCWLYALVAGSLTKEEVVSAKELEEETESFHTLPSYSAYIIIGSVCALYGIFFISAFIDLLNGNIATTAHEASEYAVGSFRQLVRVVVLNMAIMGASCFVSKEALWTQKKTRILATILFVFALAFALLAAFQLGVYIVGYGFTPRRILSSWVVVNIVVWCVLILVRLYKKISAAQIGILCAAATFSIVVLGNF